LVILKFVLFITLYGVPQEVTAENKLFITTLTITVYVGIFLGMMAFIYHIKSFKYYRKSKRMKRLVKVHPVFWVVSILSHVYFLLFGLIMLLGVIVEMIDAVRGRQSYWGLIMTVVVLAYAITSIVEATILKKRIKRYEEEIQLRGEIDTIGISNL
jgi:amino acid transporter